jgi:tetratricopeptide (TPR) repeat protein
MSQAWLGGVLPAEGQRVRLASWRSVLPAENASQGRDLLGDEVDPLDQSLWRQTAALVHAKRGETAEAEHLASEAVALLDTTDSTGRQGDALFDLGVVLEAAGRRDDAAATLRDALERYERKGIVPLARRTRERLATLSAV